MSDESIVLSPEEEARRLWAGALEAAELAEDLVPLCESIGLGLRAAEIRVVQLLQPVRDRFPATITGLLGMPEPEVDAHRDAIDVPRVMEFLDVIDLLSEASLECVSPELHRGWEDRRFSCRRSRETAQDAVGVVLGPEQQEDLLLLTAYRNRIFRLPPPVMIVPGDVREAFRGLEELMEDLLPDG